MKNQFNTVLFFIFTLFFEVKGQSPNSFTIGQDEFANIDVYTTFYDSTTDILHIGTNDGLFQYTQNKFRPLAIPIGSSSKSFFDLKTNKDGELFCFNLNGQIFKWSGENWELYFEDKGFVNDGYTNYGFNDSNELIFIGTRRLLKIGEDRSVVDLLNKNNINADSVTIQSSCFFYLKKIILVSGVLEKRDKTGRKERFGFKVITDSIVPFSSLSHNRGFLFYIDKYLFRYENNFICPKSIKTKLRPINVHNCIGYGNSAFAFHRATGLSRLFIENDSLKRNILFKNRFVSSFYKGISEFAILGSFKNGVDVVSKLNQVSQQLGDTRITSLKSINDDLCYIGTQNGSIFQIDKNSLVLGVKNRSRAIQYLFLDTSRNILLIPYSYQNDLFERVNKTKYELKEFRSVFKNAIRFQDVLYISVNQHIQMVKSIKDKPFKNIFSNNKKIIAFQINPITERIVFSDNEKTQSINFNGENPVFLKYGNENFTCNQIRNWKNKIVCATRNKGILIFDSNQFAKEITEQEGLISNSVKQIEIQDDILYILSKGKLQVYDLSKNEFIAVGFQDGLGFEPIQFISVAKNKIWIAELSKVYTVQIADLIEPNFPSPIYVDSILVDGKRVELDVFNFDYTQKDLKVYYDYRNLLSKNDVSIQYQLVGYDKDWKSASAFENLIEFQSLAPGYYEFKLKASIGKNEGKMFIYSFSISPPYWQQGWFYLLIIVLTLLIAYFVFRRIIARQRKRSKELLEKERLSTSLASSQLKALRAQMNPHFIFNSLNSIQNLILKQDVDGSYDYVSQFAQLVRSSLEYSDRDFVSIRKEIEFLKVYLNLESLRLEEEFSYEIQDNTGDFDLEIPSLLVQPFIENALLHGLLHKKGEKVLNIQFHLKEKLICTIEDNGVGRMKAKEIKERQGTAHESFSTSAIRKRLEIFSQKMNQKTEVVYEDVLDDSGNICGTKVILTLPFKTVEV